MAVDNVSSIDELTYCPEMPKTPRNIVSIGTGGIVQGSHYPAYKLAGFPVKACYDLSHETAQKLLRSGGSLMLPGPSRSSSSLASSMTPCSISPFLRMRFRRSWFSFLTMRVF